MIHGLHGLCEGTVLTVPAPLPEHSMRLMRTLGVDVTVDPLASPPCDCRTCMAGWRKLVSQSILDPRNRTRHKATTADDFPARLRAARRAKGMTQVELCSAIGSSRSLIALYENDYCRPSRDTLSALECVLSARLG